VTIDELRAFCLSLDGTHEKETWGDGEHAGDVTFRVRDIIVSAWRRTAPKAIVAEYDGRAP